MSKRSDVLEFVKQNGLELEHVSKELQNDKEVVLEAEGDEVIDVDTSTVTVEPPVPGAEPPRKCQRQMEAAAKQQVARQPIGWWSERGEGRSRNCG